MTLGGEATEKRGRKPAFGRPQYRIALCVLVMVVGSVPLQSQAAGPNEHALRVPVAGVFANQAPVRFYRSATFYAAFDNHALIADLSGGSGTPLSVPHTVVLERGLFGRALLAGKEPVVYRATGNVNLSVPGGLALWVSAYHWQHPVSPPWFPFVYVRDHGRTVSIARMGSAGNREAVYAYAGAGGKMVSVVAGRSLRWKNGHWHLLVVDWGGRALKFSLDGQSWKQVSLVNTGFSVASGPAGTLRIGGGSASTQRCLFGGVMVVDRPLTMGEVRWMYDATVANRSDGRTGSGAARN